MPLRLEETLTSQGAPRSISHVRSALAGRIRQGLDNGSARSAIILGVDGAGTATASEARGYVETLSSTVPSTTVNAFLTSLRGEDAESHGVWGPVMRLDGREDRVFNLLRSRSYGFGEDWVTGGREENPDFVAPPDSGTLFADVTEMGLDPWILFADYPGMARSWIAGVSTDARRLSHQASLAELRRDPRHYTRELIALLDRSLEPGRLIWAHCNLDPYIHMVGYDEIVRDCFTMLDEASVRWAEAGTFAAWYGDHGLVETTAPTEYTDAWDYLDSPRFCTTRSGGAGRTRWLYPRTEFHHVVLEHLRATLGDDAYVFEVDDPRGRVGRIAAVARGTRFPIPDPSFRWEHGGACKGETRVPLVLYGV